MEDFLIRLAELNIEVKSTYSYTKEFCKEYLTDSGSVDLIASASEEEIEADSKELGSDNMPYVESISIYRSIAEQLPAKKRLVCHGAAIEYNGKAYFFTAPSGVGKSTHIALWRQYLGESVQIINGDKPIFYVKNDGVRVYGTPWAGKERWQQNCAAPLAAICLLKRDVVNHIEKADAAEHLTEIFQQVYLPSGAEAMASTLELIDQMLRELPFYILHCDMSEAAVRTAMETLTGEKYPNMTKERRNENKRWFCSARGVGTKNCRSQRKGQ